METAPNCCRRQQVGQKPSRNQRLGSWIPTCVLLLAAAQLGTLPLQAVRPQAALGHPCNGRGEQWEREVALSQSAHGVVSCVVLAYYVWYPMWMQFVSLMTAVEHPFRCLAAILYFLW